MQLSLTPQLGGSRWSPWRQRRWQRGGGAGTSWGARTRGGRARQWGCRPRRRAGHRPCWSQLFLPPCCWRVRRRSCLQGRRPLSGWRTSSPLSPKEHIPPTSSFQNIHDNAVCIICRTVGPVGKTDFNPSTSSIHVFPEMSLPVYYLFYSSPSECLRKIWRNWPPFI